MRGSEDFAALAVLFKRVKNIAREVSDAPQARYDARWTAALAEPAELALLAEFDRRAPAIREALRGGRYRQAMSEAAALRPAVDRFFTEVFVMVDDAAPAGGAADADGGPARPGPADRRHLAVGRVGSSGVGRLGRRSPADCRGRTTAPRESLITRA